MVIRKPTLFLAPILIGTITPVLLHQPVSGQQNGGDRKAADQKGPPAPMPAILRNYAPVTAERLLKPEEANWLMIRRTYDGWGYSPLDQITPANVARLRPVWGSTTG